MVNFSENKLGLKNHSVIWVLVMGDGRIDQNNQGGDGGHGHGHFKYK